MRALAGTVNRLGADFRWQHLPVPFEVYADGIDLVIFEEFGSGAQALHLQEKLARDELMRDPAYRARFRKDYESKYGPRVWHRDFFDAEIVACPDTSVIGKSFGQVGVERGGAHPVDAFLDLVLEHGTAIRWRTTISGHRPKVLRKIAQEKGVQMGFSDAGAHLRNMAFYNFGLRLLKHVVDAERAGEPFLAVEQAVHRLTGELAEWYDLDAGRIREGDRADLMVLDPERLDGSLEDYHEAEVERTTACRGWSTATMRRSPPSSSAAARLSRRRADRSPRQGAHWRVPPRRPDQPGRAAERKRRPGPAG